MILHFQSGIFWAEAAYSERQAMKEAGFRWHGAGCPDECPACAAGIALKRWWTADAARATRLEDAADPAARAAIAALRDQIAASRATAAEIDVPVPEGLHYYPFQKAGIAFILQRWGEDSCR